MKNTRVKNYKQDVTCLFQNLEEGKWLKIGIKIDETRLFQQYCDTVTNNNVITVCL